MANLILKTLIIDKNLTIEEISKGSEIPVEEVKGMVEGRLKMTIDNAIKLSEFFKIPAEFFFTENALVTHNNLGEKSNSNSGYIGTYKND
ncbi:helix-turn-helix domain-containing protein [Anditalea andensis]|uniref:HTH cro/C1-type domain-containing protein n=1 Tax=Anditalea andensis TaxID=1048983 RepID=A0A074KZQ7_9BACT|nr:helix-turn-helix transcriptional regulator [Anditalea andensis]KEO73675.1 hypothetical protein EL17_11080 [Anditalea andensis]